MTAVQPSTVDRDLRGPPDKRLVALDDQIKSSLMEFGISGASCAVVVQQKIVYAKGFGTCTASDLSNPSLPSTTSSIVPETWFKGAGPKEVPVDADSVFPLGKGGDALVSIVIATLIEEKVLEYHTPVQSLLPNFAHPQSFATAVTTVGDVLSHRSGLPSTRTSITAALTSEVPLAAFPATLSIIPAAECPTFRGVAVWSHLNTVLLACIVAKVMGGVPLETLVRERVWNRCGASLKSGFAAEGKDDITTGAVSTPRDIARLFCSLLGGWGPLSAATLRNFWASIGVVDQQSTVEGFAGMEESQGFSVSNGGWQSSIYRGRRRLGFSSNGSGGHLEALLFPELGFAVVVASSKESHLPTAIADLACDYLFEVSTPTAWIERLATVPNPIPLPGELPMEISLPGNTSTSQSTQPAIRPLVGYAGLYISSAAPTIAVKITTDTTSLVATVSIAGAKVHPPTLLTSSHIDTFTCQIRTARPSLKQFISHEGVFHFRGTPTGQIDGVSLHPALFANMSQTLGPAVFFTKVSAGGPIQPNQTPSVNNAPVLSRTSSVISNGSASAVTGVSSNLAAPSLPPRRRQASQGPASNPQSQLQISVAPSTSNASAPLSPVVSASEPGTPGGDSASGKAVRRPPPPLPPSIRREASAVSQSSLGGPSQITLDTQKSEKISESPAVYAVPIAIAPSTSAAPAITEVPVNASQDVLPAYDIYAETSGNAWACPTPPPPVRTQRQSQSRPSSALAGPVASLTRDDSFIATASAVVASDKPTEEIEEDVESDMNALDGMFDELGISTDEGVPNPTPAPALSKLAPNGSTLSLT